MLINKQLKIKYMQLEEEFKSELLSGKFKPGDLFYTEKEIMSKYHASYATVSRTMKNMAEKGIFERHRGMGTIVREIPGFSKDLLAFQTLYFNGVSSFYEHRNSTPFSWFVREEIQKGVVNAWPGNVQISSLDDILKEAAKGKVFDAVFLSPPSEFAKEIENLQCIYTIINHARYFTSPYNSVTTDFIVGAYNLVSYLIRELGHHKIAFIGGDTLNYHADRYAGYKLALEAHNIDYREDYCIRNIDATEKSGSIAMKKLLHLNDPPTAVFADTDLKALGAVAAIKEAGLRVPDDISVAGFDNVPGLEKHAIGLTTLNLALSELGRKAIDMLVERILNNGKNIPSIIQYGEIIFRDSCSKLKI